MTKSRMEAFSDGVIAILITIMVLEFHAPHVGSLSALLPLAPAALSYVLSYVFIGIYWNNHHHLIQAVRHVNGGVLWANLHLLFWISLIPFGTAWMGSTEFAPWPVAVYGAILLMAGVAYYILAQVLIALHGADSPIAAAIGSDFKGRVSIVMYLAAIPLAFVHTAIAIAIYAAVAIMWLVPDRRIERTLAR